MLQLTMAEYQSRANETAVYPRGTAELGTVRVDVAVCYVTGKMVAEAAECSEQVLKAIRDDGGEITATRREKILKEVGDTLWYAAQICTELGVNLDLVARVNLDKLASRAARGTIQGDGDDR